MAEAPVRVPGVEGRAGKFPGPSLIPALTAIQERAGWLPREELITLSREVNRPLYEIEGLISFYPHFRTSPPRKVQVDVCHDLSCWLRGSDEALSQIRARHGRDADIEIIERSCIGRCDIAPAASVNGAPVTLAGQAPVTLVPAAVGAAIAAARHAAESGHNNGAAGASDSHRASGAHKANGL